jgi:uncharacterized membrane protein YsdA (DUF1294 family)
MSRSRRKTTQVAAGTDGRNIPEENLFAQSLFGGKRGKCAHSLKRELRHFLVGELTEWKR